MPTINMLDCSTANITKGDADILSRLTADGDDTSAGTRVVPHEHGWFVSVPVEDSGEVVRDMEKAGLSPHFIRLIGHAAGKGCRWVNLDQDADPEEGLPVHPW